jgi:chemotaxis family two-component system sensor kinase Cph1
LVLLNINVKQQHINITSLKEAPIHLINEIQPHGILLVLQEPDLQILQISRNTFNTFGISPEDMVQQELKDLLDSLPNRENQISVIRRKFRFY